MTARILILDNYRDRKAVCLMCHHTWLMPAAEPEFDPETNPELQGHLLDCPRCHNDTGLYASGWDLSELDV